MVSITNQLVESRSKTSKGKNGKRGITIHETANTGKGAGAKAHANLQSKGNVRNASWHISVDDKHAIRSFPNDVRCWHGGTTAANNNHVGIEICVNPDSDYVQACKNAADVVRQLRAEGVGDELVQHNGHTGKDCPNFMREGRDGVTWEVFKDWVANGTGSEATPAKSPAPAPAPATGLPEGRGYLDVDGKWGPELTYWQQAIAGGTRDKVISNQLKSKNNEHVYSAQFNGTRKGSDLVRWIQLQLRGRRLYTGAIDGLLGPGTVLALQRYYRTTTDGIISPVSSVVKAMQSEINTGFFLGIKG